MNQRLTVLQHHPAEAVGEIGVWAEQRDIALDIHRADLGELPEQAAARCVLLGGPCAVNDPPAWLQREKEWLRRQIARGTPILGICLGSQLLAEALGGAIRALDRPETGWTQIDFADGSQLDALQWHEDTFTLPPGAEALASSAGCAQQLFRRGPHIGIQFHPEWNAELVAALNAHFGDASPLPCVPDAQRHSDVAHWFHALLDVWSSFSLTHEPPIPYLEGKG
jgi:GMP synthase-like glutamine amidotransferase